MRMLIQRVRGWTVTPDEKTSKPDVQGPGQKAAPRLGLGMLNAFLPFGKNPWKTYKYPAVIGFL